MRRPESTSTACATTTKTLVDSLAKTRLGSEEAERTSMPTFTTIQLIWLIRSDWPPGTNIQVRSARGGMRKTTTIPYPGGGTWSTEDSFTRIPTTRSRTPTRAQITTLASEQRTQSRIFGTYRFRQGQIAQGGITLMQLSTQR